MFNRELVGLLDANNELEEEHKLRIESKSESEEDNYVIDNGIFYQNKDVIHYYSQESMSESDQGSKTDPVGRKSIMRKIQEGVPMDTMDKVRFEDVFDDLNEIRTIREVSGSFQV